jgi:hypothetical protein
MVTARIRQDCHDLDNSSGQRSPRLASAAAAAASWLAPSRRAAGRQARHVARCCRCRVGGPQAMARNQRHEHFGFCLAHPLDPSQLSNAPLHDACHAGSVKHSSAMSWRWSRGRNTGWPSFRAATPAQTSRASHAAGISVHGTMIVSAQSWDAPYERDETRSVCVQGNSGLPMR